MTGSSSSSVRYPWRVAMIHAPATTSATTANAEAVRAMAPSSGKARMAVSCVKITVVATGTSTLEMRQRNGQHGEESGAAHHHDRHDHPAHLEDCDIAQPEIGSGVMRDAEVDQNV